jgi:hypothetical protein
VLVNPFWRDIGKQFPDLGRYGWGLFLLFRLHIRSKLNDILRFMDDRVAGNHQACEKQKDDKFFSVAHFRFPHTVLLACGFERRAMTASINRKVFPLQELYTK